jgi:osmotically-inducible protein OsmY
MPKAQELQDAVLAELLWDPSLIAGQIGVAARDGIVTLTGQVEAYGAKAAAVAAGYRVKGVHGVADEIEVRLPADSVRSDADIAAAAVSRLDWNIDVPADGVHVTVRAGWITLEGQVRRAFQRAAAERDLRSLHGVTGLSNHLEILSGDDTSRLSANIVQALQRTWPAGEKIEVTNDGGRVRLTGLARTPHERDAAAWTAWAASGTTTVLNDIAIA